VQQQPVVKFLDLRYCSVRRRGLLIIYHICMSGGGEGGVYISLFRTYSILYELSPAYLCKKLHAPAHTAPLLAACLKEHHWQSFSLRKSVGVFF
jgi:hypothetical protein